MRPLVDQPYWRSPLLPDTLDSGPGQGVRVARIEKIIPEAHFDGIQLIQMQW